MRAYPSALLVSSQSCGPSTAVNSGAPPGSVTLASCVLVAVLHTRAVPSSLHVTTYRPDGLNHASLMDMPAGTLIANPSWRPVFQSQIRALPPSEVTIRVPSGLN